MVAVLTPAAGGKPIVIDKAVVLIGRHPDCDYILQNSRKVSRRHLCVVQVNDKYLVRDLGSMNGVQVNGQRVKRTQVITLGDEVAVGDVIFRFEQIQKLPRPPLNGEAPKATEPVDDDDIHEVEVVAPSLGAVVRNPDLSQNYPVPIPDEPDSFQVVQDDIPLKALQEIDPNADSDELEQVDDDAIEAEEELPVVEALRGSVEEFVPVLDADATIDEGEIEEVVLLDEEPDMLDDDDIILLD